MAVLRPHLALTVTDVQRDEMDTSCWYARQDKLWVRDPDGTPWEVFVTHEAAAEQGPCGCGATGCACAAKGAESVCCA